MATLTGQSIDSSYQGLLKTTDNGAITGTAKAVTDGLGNATNIEISNTATNFVSGTVDFTGSTVSGLPGGSAGLENGTGTDSLQSAASLTTNPADASGNYSIALGDGASATRQESVAIGQNAAADGTGSDGSIAIGNGAVASANKAIAIGVNGTTNSSEGIVIGDNVDISGSDRSIGIGNAQNISGGNDKIGIGTSATVGGTRGIAIGQNATADGSSSVVMGYNASDNGAQDCVIIGNGANAETASDDYSVVIGLNAQSTVGNGIAIGYDAQSDGINTIMIGRGAAGSFNTVGIGVSVSAQSNESIAIGYDADTQSGSNNSIAIGVYSEVTANNTNAIAIGQTASAQAPGAVALGKQVVAAKTDTVSVQALETQTNSTPTAGGIIMSDAGGTERRLNITATGDLQIDSNAVGGGGAALHSLGGNLEGRMYYDSAGTNPSGTYRTWVNTTGYFIATAAVSNRAAYSLFTMVPGEDINKVAINVNQAAAAATGEIAFYDTEVNADGFIYLNNRLQSLGTVDMSTTGWKEITLGTAYTVPTGLKNNTIAIVAFPSSTSANFGGWSGSMAMTGAGYFLSGGVPYRSLHLHANPGVSPGTALPATIGDAGGSVDYKASTSNPLAVMIN